MVVILSTADREEDPQRDLAMVLRVLTVLGTDVEGLNNRE
jgi:hypothetical protein